jgi:hypothetical protein
MDVDKLTSRCRTLHQSDKAVLALDARRILGEPNATGFLHATEVLDLMTGAEFALAQRRLTFS